MLDYEELSELEQAILDELQENLLSILTRLNRTDGLEEALSKWGLDHLLKNDNSYKVYKTGKIIVIGQSDVPKDVLLAIASKAGIEKNRLELYLDYNAAKSFEFKRLQWNPSYSAILVGPQPHSGTSKGEAGSVISAIENIEGYPPVIRLGNNSLKITKSDFKVKIKELIDKGVITR